MFPSGLCISSVKLNCFAPLLPKNGSTYGSLIHTSGSFSIFSASIEGEHAKCLKTASLFTDFFKSFDSIYKGTMDQMIQAYGFSKETVTTSLVSFYDMLTIVGYFMPNPVYAYTYQIWFINTFCW